MNYNILSHITQHTQNHRRAQTAHISDKDVTVRQNNPVQTHTVFSTTQHVITDVDLSLRSNANVIT